MLRVLMVCTVETGPSGIPNVIFNLLEAFDRTDMKIGYVSINPIPPTYLQRLTKMGISSYVLSRRILSAPSYVRDLAKIARDYDVVHVHGNSATMVLEMLGAYIAKVKGRIAHAHNTSCSAKFIHWTASPLFHHLCSARLACGTEAGKWLFGARPFKVIPNAIDSPRFRFNAEVRARMRRSLNLDDGKVIGHVGYFQEVKNHSFLIDIFKDLHAEVPEARLLLIGDGPLRQEIERKCRSLGIEESVRFVGNVSNPQDYLQAMDAICMPSIYEGLPLTLIEQQVNGLPIVASDRITTDADKTGLLEFLPLEDSPEIWARALKKSLQLHPRSLDSSDRAIAKIKDAGFDITEVARDLKNFYSNAIS